MKVKLCFLSLQNFEPTCGLCEIDDVLGLCINSERQIEKEREREKWKTTVLADESDVKKNKKV